MNSGSSNRTKLVYVAPGDILKGRVEPIQYMRMCQAFSRQGLQVELVAPYVRRSENIATDEVWDHFGVRRESFQITVLPTPLSVESGLWWIRGCRFGFNAARALRLLFSSRESNGFRQCIVYTKCYSSILPYLKLARLWGAKWQPIFIQEVHQLPTNLTVGILKQMDGLVALSQRLKDHLVERLRFDPSRILVAHQVPNIDSEMAGAQEVSKEDARRRLRIPIDKRIVGYTGKPAPKEIAYILETAKILGDEADFLIAGGNPRDTPEFQERANREGIGNVTFVGFVPPSQISWYQRASDVLVIYTTDEHGGLEYMSPAKMWDYMLAKKPIVSARYPVLEEVLSHRKNCIFVEPEDPKALAEGIREILRSSSLAKEIAEQAYRDGRGNTWRGRVRRILRFAEEIRDFD